MVRTGNQQLCDIDSVHSFISAVLTDPVDGVEPFFRGASRIFPKTAPSVFRKEKWRSSEKDLFNSLLASHPGSFIEDITTLDRLVRMQHHGLPTRLLDITSNPLMALFFASNSHPDMEVDGEVTRFEFRAVDVKYPDSDRAAVMANLARLTPKQRQDLNFSLPKNKFNELPAAKKLLHFIKQEKSYFEPLIRPSHINSIMVIRGKQNNARIIAQAGAFLLFGEGIEFENSSKARDLRKRTYIIQARAKKHILWELDQLNVNARTVFPSLESSAAYLKSRFAVTRSRKTSVLS